MGGSRRRGGSRLLPAEVVGCNIAVSEAARQKALYQGAELSRWLAGLGHLI